MAIKWKHDDSTTMYFCTFTCYQWLPLIDIVNGYDMVYKWFDHLKQQGYGTIAFVIMPNHVHTILYFPNAGFDLNKIIGNGKRFMAYEIIKRLEQLNRQDILNYLANGLTAREKRKGQLHKAFTDSFDAKGIYNEKFFNQKLKYIHRNPVSGKWQLVKNYTEYEHSSASFYETGKIKTTSLLITGCCRALDTGVGFGQTPVRQLPTVQEQDPARTKRISYPTNQK